MQITTVFSKRFTNFVLGKYSFFVSLHNILPSNFDRFMKKGKTYSVKATQKYSVGMQIGMTLHLSFHK